MPEPLKNLYNLEFVASLSRELKSIYDHFDSEGFKSDVFNNEWENKELKDRLKHISETLHQYLPSNYQQAIKILMEVSSKFSGFEAMIFPGYVELYGLDKYENSIYALEHFTKHSSSEFAVRPFIKKYGEKMMEQMEKWAKSKNHHVRRLASEGCRPRLPWAIALPEFKKDPRPVITVLEILKNDESEYVRRSVANNLNDISKDNPQILIDLAKTWLDKNSNLDWVVKHACRSLLKQGNPTVMKLFGFRKPDNLRIEEFLVQKSVNIGNSLKFSFMIKATHGELGKLRIEYAIDFLKKNGKRSRKLFKISEARYSGQSKIVNKNHSFKVISTRKYYSGMHGIAVIINGHELFSSEFQLNDKV